MNAKAEAKESRSDLLKWPLVAVLVVVAVVDNQYSSAQPALYRVPGIFVLAVIAVFLALQTAGGRAFLSLTKEVRVEIRKVVWPSRQETTQATLIVVTVVLATMLLLWGFDPLLGWLVSMIVG